MKKGVNVFWLNYFRPNLFVKNINEINIFSLLKNGIKTVLIDLDNTLVPHFTKFPNKSAIAFIAKLTDAGIKVIVVSNNTKKRVETFCNFLRIDDFVYNAKKPLLTKVKKIIKKHNLDLDDIIVIGDQAITDIWMSNRLKLKSILVLPLVNINNSNEQNFIITFIEKFIYNKIQHSNLSTNNKVEENYDVI